MAQGYPDLVPPLIPNAQENKAPSLLLEGAHIGFQAAAQFAQMKRQNEEAMARLAFQERMAQEQHALEQQKLAQAAELIPSQIKANKAHADLMTEQSNAYAEGIATASQIKTETTKQKNLLLQEVADTARELKLDDAHFQTKNPMEFAKNVIDFHNMYHLSPVPEVRKAIKDYQAIADSQKLFIKHGAVDDNGAIKGVGQGRQVPAWRIVMNAQNPDTREQTMRDLEASGYMDLVKGSKEVTKEPTWFQKITGQSGDKTSEPTVKKVLRAPVKQYMDEAQTLPADETAATAPIEAPATAMPDYGPIQEAPQYPIGTRGKRGGQWFVLTDEGWKPE